MTTDLTQHALVIGLLAFTGFGVYAVEWAVEYVKSWLPEGRIAGNRTRLLSILLSFGYAGLLLGLGMLDAGDLAAWSPAVKVIGLGLILGAMTSGKHSLAHRKAAVPTLDTGSISAEAAEWVPAPTADQIADAVVARISARNGS